VGLLFTFLFACILFSTTVAALYLANVEDMLIKIPIACGVFFLGLIIGLIYICYFKRRNRVN